MLQAMKKLLALLILMSAIALGCAVDARPVRQITIKVTELGYEPERVQAVAGQPLRITFLRELDSPCAETVLLPDFSIRRDLPMKRPVTVEITPRRAGTFPFTCGMKMMRGTLVVTAH
jgi:plastocyanin domain-containing protein